MILTDTKRTQSIARNVSLTMLGNAFNKVCFFIAGILIAKHLGADGFGVYSFAVFFSYVFAAVADGGLQAIIVRDIAANQTEADLYLGNTLIIKIGLSFLSLLLLVATMPFWGLPPLTAIVVCLAALATLIYSFGQIAVGIFRARGWMVYEGTLLVVQGTIFVGLGLLVVALRGDVLWCVGALLISYALTTFLGFFLMVRHFVRPRWRLDRALVGLLLKEAFPIGISLVLFTLYARFGTLALQATHSSEDVGLYAVAYSLTRNLIFIPLAVSAALLPAFAGLASSSRSAVSSKYARTLEVMFALSMPICVIVTVRAKQIVQLLYGSAYLGASLALQITVWSLVFLFMSLVTKSILEATNGQQSWTKAMFGGMVVSLGLNLALVTPFGIAGASYALLFTDATIFLIGFCFAARRLPLPMARIGWYALKCLAATAILGVFLVVFQRTNLFLMVVLGGVVYAVAMWMLRAFDQDDLDSVKRIFHFEGTFQRLPKKDVVSGKKG